MLVVIFWGVKVMSDLILLVVLRVLRVARVVKVLRDLKVPKDQKPLTVLTVSHVPKRPKAAGIGPKKFISVGVKFTVEHSVLAVLQ